ncbi:hypothetical protein J3A83DRAFT_4400422 [Scleroderma citrinum]
MDTQSAASYVRQLQAPLVGSFISLIFYGISCVQTFFYFQTYPNDRKLLKWMVAVIWILESVHSGFIISFNNSYFINGFSDPAIFEHIIWDFMVNIEIGFIIILIVNLFFIWRVWMLSRRAWVIVLLLFLVIAPYGVYCQELVFLTYSILMPAVLASVSILIGFFDNTWTSFMEHALAIAAASMGATVLADTLIASTLAYYLYSRRAQSSTRMVTRLLAYVVGTGALTSIFSVIELICILSSPNTLLSLLFELIQVKIYANSALLSLNLRQYQRQEDVVPSLGNVNTTSGDSKLFITPV